MKTRLPLLVASVLLYNLCECCIDRASDHLQINLPSSTPGVFGRVELTVSGMPESPNPFDAERIALDLEVTSPSGKVLKVPGFFMREFERRLDGNREHLVPKGNGEWRIRWLPSEPGRHRLTAAVKVEGRPVDHSSITVEIAPTRNRGIARVETKSRRYFKLDDSTPLFLNGLCACWHGSRGTYDYDDWLAAYQKAGINYIRLWMWPIAFGIEWDKNDKLNYRMDTAWQLDYVLAEAERRGIYVMLCLDYHGIFEVKPDYWGGNNYWPRHPYNSANGGPCKNQNEFFTNAEAKRLYANRLRYIVARWSAFPNLLAWEFFNEIDNEYAYLKHEDVVAWHQEMGKKLRALDPAGHMISSSFTGGSERPGLFDLEEMDFSQYHSYNEKHPARMTAEKTARFFEKYKKPFFVSEYGTDWRGWKPETDPHFRALHQAVWSGAFTGAAGTGMTWWWESIHAANLYHHWSALSKFLAGTGIGRANMAPAKLVNTEGNVLAFGVSAPDEALIWILDKAYDWPEGATESDPALLTGAKVRVYEVSDGEWYVEWWNTLTGQKVAAQKCTAKSGSVLLEPPPFKADIAARLKKAR
ncbi:MAG: DUF5060 domain-containing protein [Verrucomicrobiae bacterium]|nr:DUF5060 domain-containing protein [Verrucomicrobiae bacterium]